MLYIALILLFLKILAWNKACLVMTVSILSTLKDIIIVCVNMSKFIPQQETKLQTRRLAFCIFNNSLHCLTKSRNTDSDPVYTPLLGQMWQRFKLGTRPGMTRVGHVCCLRGGGVTPKHRPCRLQNAYPADWALFSYSGFCIYFWLTYDWFWSQISVQIHIGVLLCAGHVSPVCNCWWN